MEQNTKKTPTCCIGCDFFMPQSLTVLGKECGAFGDCSRVQDDVCGLRSPPLENREHLYMKKLEQRDAQYREYCKKNHIIPAD